MYDILKAAEAARVIGCGAPEVRHKLRIGTWKFGRAISPQENKKSQWQYEINKRDLARFLQIDVEEIDKRLEGGTS